MSGDRRLTRRAVLLGAAATVVAACRPKERRPIAHPDPDLAAVQQAIAGEAGLLGTLSALTAAGDDTTAERGVHADHLIALKKLLGADAAAPGPASATPAPSASPQPAGRKTYDAAVAASVPRLQAAALAARRGSTAALLASVAASHAAPGPRAGARFGGGGS